MATLVLQTAGSLIGSAVGGPLGGMLGRAAGALVGSMIDQSLLGTEGGSTKIKEGPRLKEMEGLGSTEGASIPKIYGRVRIGGQVIWATRFEEVANTTVKRSRSSGGKGGAASASPKQIDVTYSYFANFAVGICEGSIAFIRRIWADGREIDLNSITFRVYTGSQTQSPDPLIVAKEGANFAPAYRGLCYIVFERFPLAGFGNRIPQLSFEVIRTVDGVAQMMKAVCLIPAATEFGYEPSLVMRVLGVGQSVADNRQQLTRDSNIRASLDALQALCPNVKRVSLVVSWFGDDLRAGSCTIAPRVEDNTRTTDGAIIDASTWHVAQLTRASAQVVSQINNKPAYGGTPSDQSVIRLIQNLKLRGLEVVLYPFIMMDVPQTNTLQDPWSSANTQPAYPWRGRITCHPAPDRVGTPDGTSAAATQIAQVFGTASPSDFNITSGAVAYTGAAQWTLRRQILHYAHLAELAGGVDGFIIGSEMISLTRVRSASGVYPAVQHYVALAQDVRTVLRSSTQITYAADWTEYGAHVRNNGTEIRFPLDLLWASNAIDAVGIDFYPPLSDWRDKAGHLDSQLTTSITDVPYLRERIGAGEAFDWFYSTPAHRDAQIRTPITDGAYNKPWIYRAKDLIGWWSNTHIERVGGVEQSTSSAWIAKSKPIWLTEIGIPAVDKGTNSPNVFPDPKSSESAMPAFSNALRDDLIQIRGLEAILTRFDASLPNHLNGANPVSNIYSGTMIDVKNVFVWAWDARPFPAFPSLKNIWSDAENWQTGHWITGRIEGAAVDDLISQIITDYHLTIPVKANVEGFVDGYIIDRPMSAREALEPVLKLFGIDASTSGGELNFTGRRRETGIALTENDFVPDKQGILLNLTRAQETELPVEVRLGFTDSSGDYRRAAIASRRLGGSSTREAKAEIPVVMRRSQALSLCEIWLYDTWVGRESVQFSLPMRYLALEVGDTITLNIDETMQRYRITRIQDERMRRINARRIDPAVYDRSVTQLETQTPIAAPAIAGKPAVRILDLPMARQNPETLQYMACFAQPWPNALAVWRSIDGVTFELFTVSYVRSVMGATLTPFQAGALMRWDVKNTLDVILEGGFPHSISDIQALQGQNTFAIQGSDSTWEIFTAARCELIGEKRFLLSRFLRGLGGSEKAAARTVLAGAPLVLLDDTLIELAQGANELGRTYHYRVGSINQDHADSAYINVSATPTALALKPYAPVRVRAKRGIDGIHITFIRRTRINGDAWEPVDVPLSEESERYEVDIVAGASVVRTLNGATPDILYPTAVENADFGSPQAVLSLRVMQLSAAVGRGEAWEGNVIID